MCLQYKHERPAVIPQTMYKVYVQLPGDKALYSPYHWGNANGVIHQNGRYHAEKGHRAAVFSPTGVTSVIVDELSVSHNGFLLEIAGFHCIPTEEEAKRFAAFIERTRVRQFAHGNAAKQTPTFDDKGIKIVIVPVTVLPEHVIAYGSTPFDPIDNIAQQSVETYVVSQMYVEHTSPSLIWERYLGNDDDKMFYHPDDPKWDLDPSEVF